MSTGIEWTDETWNPTVGCSRVSPGCDNCYAEKVAARGMQDAHRGLTRDGKWTGEVRLLPDRLDQPLRWRKPRRVFVDSMSDLFHPDVPQEFVEEVFAVMALADQHTFQVLTKRPQLMARTLGNDAFADECDSARLRRNPHRILPDFPPPNVWLGTSVENQRYADLRIPHLLATPAAVRFLSIEPLLGPVDLSPWVRTHDGTLLDRAKDIVDWVIVGGESGPGARPMHPDWVRSIRDQCVAAGVPFFFKQWGEWKRPTGAEVFGDTTATARAMWIDFDGSTRPAPSVLPTPTSVPMWRVGKKAAGRELDGRTWDDMAS